jgi:hypothetical protein
MDETTTGDSAAEWLDGLSARRLVRRHRGLRLFACEEASSGAARLCVVQSSGDDGAGGSVAARLDAMHAAHVAAAHHRIAAPLRRGCAGEIEYLLFATPAVTDLEAVLAHHAREGADPFTYEQGEALKLIVLDALGHAHARRLAGGRPLTWGASSPAAIVVTADGALALVGLDDTLLARAEDSPGLDLPIGARAPSAEDGATLAAKADLFAFAALERRIRRFFSMPDELATALAGKGAAALRETVDLVERAAADVDPTNRPIAAAGLRAALERRHRLLGVAPDAAGLAERLASITRAIERLREERIGFARGLAQGTGERYRFLRTLGVGSTSTVQLAWDRQVRQHVAVKQLDLEGDAEWVARLLRELRVLREVRHPRLVRGYEIFAEQGRLGIVMEHVDGEPWSSALDQEQVDLGFLLGEIAAIADAVAELHRFGVCHRDIRPANVLIDPVRGATLVDLGAAGVARGATGPLTVTGRTFGSPAYRAPELESGDAGSDAMSTTDLGIAADVYALGRLAEDALARSSSEADRTVAAAAATCVRAALHRDPVRRGTAAELAAALRTAIAAANEVEGSGWIVSIDGSEARSPDGRVVDLRHRGSSRRLLACLASELGRAPGEAVPAEDLVVAGWPGDRAHPEAARNRLHVALSQLRKLGLAGLLVRDERGYFLDPLRSKVVP